MSRSTRARKRPAGAQRLRAPDAVATRVKSLSPLAALTIAATSLPAFAASQPLQTSLSLGAANYGEADVPQHLKLSGDIQRYDIDIQQLRLLTPVGRDWSLGLAVSRETMSGASPWATVMGPDGKPTLIMSGATIQDKRTQVSLSGTQYFENGSLELTLTRSEEDDYESDAVAISGDWEFDSGLTTLSAGISYASDTIEPSDAIAFGRIPEDKRQSRSLSLGVTQVLDRSSVVFAGLGATSHSGYLSDPYKLRDIRPRERFERALAVRYRRFLDNLRASLHVDYRYYTDDWGIASHTFHTSWYQNVGTSFQLVPNVRYYSQTSADFFRLVDDYSLPLDVDQSSDFRLASYGALTLGLKGVLHFSDWSMTVSVDRYRASEKYGLESGHEHPALLEFTLVSVAFDLKF